MTSTTWKSWHNRGEVLRSVVSAADLRRDGLLPMHVAGVAETFGDELTLLAALQLRWHTRLAGHIERVQMHQPMDLGAAVRAAWVAAADELPGVRLVLDRYRAEPLDDAMAEAMRKATAKEHQMLAVMAGLAGIGDADAAPIGARIEAEARREHGDLLAAACRRARGEVGRYAVDGPGLLRRLRALVAA